MGNKTKKRDHADFQNSYRRSSNFGKTKDDSKGHPKGDGTLEYDEETGKDVSEIREVVDGLLPEEDEEE